MKFKSKWSLALALTLFTLVAAGEAVSAGAKYTVYCCNGRIEIDSRSLEQMKAARGGNVCALADFTALGDAEKYASQQGGKGSPCKCR